MSITALSKKERYLLTVAQKETDRPPIWLMRQAGRYMPEYMALKEKYTFREFCLNPEVAAAATLLPLQILDIDIQIIFNDILIPLEEMGLKVEFPGGGPQISPPIRGAEDLDRFNVATFSDPPVAHSIRLLKSKTGDTPVLGFCGAPFTLATYAVEGKMSKSQHHIKELRFGAPEVLHEMLERITQTAANYLISQIDEGHADGVQIFESWGGILALPHDYEEFAASYQRKLIAIVKKACPDTPIHLFVKGSNGVLESMAETGAQVLSIDWTTPLADARRRVSKTLQGNLDPIVLHTPDAIDAAVEHMLDEFDWKKGWIANLGHGILPQAKVEGAKRYVQAIQALAAK
ncbi:uroporphyrinogen decarboxylase [bacterium]|nr:uroporphyrinogen decarboxylase [bacterium]